MKTFLQRVSDGRERREEEEEGEGWSWTGAFVRLMKGIFIEMSQPSTRQYVTPT